MECIKCKTSMFDRMLHRTEPIGQENAGWMCMPCIEKHEPELAANMKSDEDFQVVKDVEDVIKDLSK